MTFLIGLRSRAAGLLFVGVLSAGMIATALIVPTISVQAAERAKPRSMEEILRGITESRPGDIPNLSGQESEVTFRMGNLWDDRWHVPGAAEEPAFLQVMRDDKQDLAARLCAAGFLLESGNEAARKFILDCLE